MKKRLRNLLSELLPSDDLASVCNSYDIVGDIAIIRLTSVPQENRQKIAEALMKTNRNVKTVLAQVGPVHGDFRIRNLEHVSGLRKTKTSHAESGCIFSVDVQKCHFSPRLSYERMRIARQVKRGEVVVNMFSGVGCFSLLIAKHSGASKVYSIDVNPEAVKLMQENVRLNGAYGVVVPILGDASRVIEERLCNVADRILMPLPEKALAYLPYALLALHKSGGRIHFYDFEHARKSEDPAEKVKQKVAEKLSSLQIESKTLFGRIVRSTGPNWYQVVLDLAAKDPFGKFNKRLLDTCCREAR